MSLKSTAVLGLSAVVLSATLAYAQSGTSSTMSSSAPAAAPAAAPAKAKMTAKPTMSMKKLDLNSASKEELTKLPGITDEIAEKIIAARPFKMRTELRSKSILTPKEYAKIAARVTAKQEKTASATAK